MKSTVKIYDEVANDYLKKWPGVNEHIGYFLSLLPKNSKILDAGCGLGFDTNFAISKGFDVVGIDESKNMIAIAKKNYKDVRFKVRDIQKMIFKPNSFNGLICAFVIQHIRKKSVHKLVEQFHTFLDKNGVLYIALQNGKSKEVYIKEPLRQNVIFMNIYSLPEINKILEDSGFDIVKKFVRRPKINENQFNKLYIIAKKV